MGNYIDKLKEVLDQINALSIKLELPRKGTCLRVSNKHYSALVGYLNDGFNNSLIRKDGPYKYKILSPSYKNCIDL